MIWEFGMVLFCLGLFLGVLPSTRLFAKQQLSGSSLPPLLSECVLLLHAVLPGWCHGHGSAACPAGQGMPTTLSPQPWYGIQCCPAPGVSHTFCWTSCGCCSWQLLNRWTDTYTERTNWISTVGTTFHITKQCPFTTELLPVPQCWVQTENRGKNGFSSFHHVTGWSDLDINSILTVLVLLPRLFPTLQLTLVTGSSSKGPTIHIPTMQQSQRPVERLAEGQRQDTMQARNQAICCTM